MNRSWFDQKQVRATEEILYSYREYMSTLENLEPRINIQLRDNPTFSKNKTAHSQTESIALRRIQFPRHIQIIREKKEGLPLIKQKILEKKYFYYQYDYEIWKELGIGNNYYYQARKEIIMFFACAFNIEI